MTSASVKLREREDELSEEAQEARRRYFREWKQKNRDKVKEYDRKFWEKKARENGNGGE